MSQAARSPYVVTHAADEQLQNTFAMAADVAGKRFKSPCQLLMVMIDNRGGFGLCVTCCPLSVLNMRAPLNRCGPVQANQVCKRSQGGCDFPGDCGSLGRRWQEEPNEAAWSPAICGQREPEDQPKAWREERGMRIPSPKDWWQALYAAWCVLGCVMRGVR